MKWSRKFFPKVFGGVFWIALFYNHLAFARNSETEAINKATEAALIYSGVKDRLTRFQKEQETNLLKYIKNNKLETEFSLIGVAAKISRDKRIDFQYQGNQYTITPNSISVRIPF